MNKRKMLKKSNIVMIFFVFAAACNGAEKPGYVPPQVSISSLLPSASKILKEGLSDENPRIRTISAEAVATSGAAELMPAVERLLKDEFVPVRFTAAIAVGDLRYNQAQNKIQELEKDSNENVKIAAAYALYKLGKMDSVETVRKEIANLNQTVRANATVILGKIGAKNDVKLLYWALRDNNSEDKVRLQAVQAIASLGDEKIYPKLWAMLINTYADDRLMGVEGMGALGTSDAKNSLIKMLSDNVLEIRLAAAEQLGKLKDKTGEPEVIDVFEKNLLSGLDKEDLDRAKVRTALAIGQVATEKLQRYLPQLLGDESKIVRIAAAKAVFQISKKG